MEPLRGPARERDEAQRGWPSEFQFGGSCACHRNDDDPLFADPCQPFIARAEPATRACPARRGPSGQTAAVRLRVGVVMWALSWVPYGIILGLSGVWLTLSWIFELTLGIVGIALAGTEFGSAVKTKGWRGAPRVAWTSFVHGTSVD